MSSNRNAFRAGVFIIVSIVLVILPPRAKPPIEGPGCYGRCMESIGESRS